MRLPAYLRTIPTSTYQSLRLSSEEEKSCGSESDEEDSPRDERSRRRAAVPAVGTIIVSLIVLFLAVSLAVVTTLYVQLLHQHSTPQPQPHSTQRPLLTCGKTIEEARHAGCTFDRLTKAWLPAACPRDYEEEFLRYPATASAAGLNMNMTEMEWTYWTGLDATQEITDDDMAVFAETLPRHAVSWVSTMRMHLAHCAFGLMRRVDALDDGRRIDLALAPRDHAHHCLGMLLEAAMQAPGIDAPVAQGSVIFGAC